ncbi:MAG: hypothetical protein ACXAB2_03950 [Candidatus Hodarchaeales archaeon]|jgi:hypothetical protein
MYKKLIVNHHISLLLLLGMVIFCGSIIQVNGSVDKINAYYEEIPNITIKITIPTELEFLNSSVHGLNVDGDATEFSYDLGSLELDEKVLFTVVYNVTSNIVKNPLTLQGANVSYQLLNGISSYHISNSVDISLRGVRAVTDTNTLPQLPEPTNEAEDYQILIAYILPIAAFGVSVVVLRRLRR